MRQASTRKSDAGLTLIEVLMVLVLVSVLGGVVALSAGRLQAAPGLDRRAETLAARLTIAAETAAVTGLDAAFIWTPDSYRFLLLRAGETAWGPHDTRELTLVEAFDGGAQLSAVGAGQGTLIIRADLLPPDPAPFRMTLRDGPVQSEVVFDGLTAQVVTEEVLR